MQENIFKNAMSRWVSGVAVVTVKADDLFYGLTVSSFTSVSLNPPMILVCIGKKNRLTSMVEQSRAFGMSVLHKGQKKIANYFASRDRIPAPSFPGVTTLDIGDTETPVIEGAVFNLECALSQIHDAGDHSIILGEVKDVVLSDNKKTLVYHDRKFCTTKKIIMPEFNL